ncbi:porin family protein [Labilibacter sediminis]|nr:porin family protein [Labilibacter sediminis]
MKRISSQFSLAKCFLLVVVFMFPDVSVLRAQTIKYGDIGVGAGLSYGGFGARLTYMPVEKLGLFGSLGYNLDDVGYNVGVQFHVPFEKKLSPYFTAMYGYNTVLIVEAIDTESSTTYFGFSAGAGVQFKLKEKSFLCAEVLVPIRAQAYTNAVDDLKSVGYEIKDPLPVAFCIGYHFKF